MRQAPDRLAGIVEADEIFLLESRKGARKLERKPRRRDGKARKRCLSREQVPILVAADRAGETLSHTLPALNVKSVKQALEPVVAPDALLVSDANRCYPPVAAALDIPHESISASAGERVRGALHIQTVNSRHSQIKGFSRRRRGIATKYLDSYLRWFHLIELGAQPSPRRPRPRRYLRASDRRVNTGQALISDSARCRCSPRSIRPAGCKRRSKTGPR